MPTYRQRSFIRRAIDSLLAQTRTDWELVLVNDGSPDQTLDAIEDMLVDDRIRAFRNERNTGLGAALNQATAQARGRYIAYLPSDDVYHSDHLARLVERLDEDPDVYLAYGGVRKGFSSISPDDPDWLRSATLLGDGAVGREAEALATRAPAEWDDSFKSGNLLALVQVAHRRSLETVVRWPTRTERTSDGIEADHWRELLAHGAVFSYIGKPTCQWTQHPYQRHRIIGGRPNEFGRMVGGLAMYRSYHGIERGTYLNWQPTQGFKVDERARSADLHASLASAAQPDPRGGLRILVVGDLGFNPERLMLLEQQGHQLAGIWTPEPELWMVTGPFPWGNIRDIPLAGDWRAAVRDFAPDVIYAGLGWPSMPLAHQILDAGFDAPFVLHFKEGPGYLYRHGLWPAVSDLMERSDGRVYFNDEYRQWFASALGRQTDPNHLVMDGERPLRAWFTDDFAPKLSAADGEIHTACTGRWLCRNDWREFVEAGIHVHIYGEVFHDLAYGHIPAGVDTGYVHLHPTVQPVDWVRELSRYDAGWLHIFESNNRGELRTATWSDLNYPGRIATYAAAGIPWIMRDNASAGNVTAVENLAAKLGVGIPFNSISELGGSLRDRDRVDAAGRAMRSVRDEFTFDAQIPDLISFFRRTIARFAGRSHAAGRTW